MSVFVVKRRTDRLRLTRKLKRTGYPGAAADAYAGGVAIPMAVQRFARTLRLLRSAEHLGPAWRFLSRDTPHLISGAQSPQPAAALVGALCPFARTFPSPFHESPILDRWPLADSGKPQEEPSAESRMLESVRAKAKWLSYSTLLPRFSRLAISIIDVEWPATRSANPQCPARNSQTRGA